MLTNSGIKLAAGLALCVVGLIGLIVTARQYLHKGPLFSMAYFVAPKEKRETLKTKRAYRLSGNVFLVLTTVSLLLGLSFVFDKEALALMGAVVALGETGAGLVFLVSRD